MPHQVSVHSVGGCASFGDRPDHKRLAAHHVAGSEDPGVTALFKAVHLDVAATIESEPELAHRTVVLGVEKAHGEQD